jgi:prophage regulatory protein
MQHLKEVTRGFEPAVRLLSWVEVQKIVPLSRSTVWRRIRDGRFPVPLQISPGRVAWLEQEILAWLAAQNRAR